MALFKRMKKLRLLGLGAILFLQREFEEFREYCYRMVKMVTETALKRIEILNFYKKYGLSPTLEAFKISKRTLYRWQAKLKASQGRLESLNNKPRRPKKLRQSKINPLLIEKISQLRKEHPRLGERKIKVFLDKYCADNHLPLISHSTIGRIIKKYNLYFHKPIKQPHKPQIRWKKVKKLRKPKDYNIKNPGDLIEIDSLEIYLNGLKRYLLTAVDIMTRQGFAFAYNSLSSEKAKDFLMKLKKVFLGEKIIAIKTDNGGEFLKYFHQYLEENKIIHFFNYPRRPQYNPYIERFNGILQEEFVNHNVFLLFEDIKEFNNKLLDYLFWYNTERPHYSLNMKTPFQYTLETLIKNKKCHMYVGWTPS